MRENNIKNSNTKKIAIFTASLLFLISYVATTSSSNLETYVYAASQSNTHNDNSILVKSNSNTNNNHPSGNSNGLVCESSITVCPPPTGGSSGSII
jgi:hypothetical protein